MLEFIIILIIKFMMKERKSVRTTELVFHDIRLSESKLIHSHLFEKKYCLKNIKTDSNDIVNRELIELIKKLEGFIHQSKTIVPQVIYESLKMLKSKQFFSQYLLPKQNCKKRKNMDLASFAQNKENIGIDEKLIKSFHGEEKTVNLRKIKLKKLESKQLFKRIDAVKYEFIENQHFNECQTKDLTHILRGKIDEKDAVISQLHLCIDELKFDLDNFKQKIQKLTKDLHTKNDEIKGMKLKNENTLIQLKNLQERQCFQVLKTAENQEDLIQRSKQLERLLEERLVDRQQQLIWLYQLLARKKEE